MNKSIKQAAMISDKKGIHSFIFANTGSSEKGGMHQWSILDIESKTDIFFFDSFGLDGLKHFIVQDDREVIEKILFGTEKMTRNDKKRTLCNIRFNLNTCKNLSAEEIYALGGTACNFFRFVQACGNKLSNYVIL